jgi:hypothetical protein
LKRKDVILFEHDEKVFAMPSFVFSKCTDKEEVEGYVTIHGKSTKQKQPAMKVDQRGTVVLSTQCPKRLSHHSI